MRVPLLAVTLVVLNCWPSQAQQARPSLFAVDSALSVDQSRDETGADASTLMFDAIVSADLGKGFEAIVWPIAHRRFAEWNTQIWIASVRYERSGTIGLRVDAGLIPAPVGLANLTLRPHLNPTISQPSSLHSQLRPIELAGPRTNLMGAAYPFGGQVTVAAQRWDARAAIIDSSPVRPREVFARDNPPRFTNVVVGGGITPVVGVRFGASVTRGGWRLAEETPSSTADQQATLVTVESEVAFRYTKVTGEWVRDALESDGGTHVASGWFVQGQQTLTPRWFVAARFERISAPMGQATGTVEQRLNGIEETVGYRLTPEITVRGGHRARRSFGRDSYMHQASVSLVWWRRWR